MQMPNHQELDFGRSEIINERLVIDRAVTTLQPLNKLIGQLCSIKRKYGFDLDEIVIFAACGIINLSGAKQNIPFVQAANISSIAEYIRLPRETVRRKLQHIESVGLISRRSSGYFINSPKEWLSVVHILASPLQS